MSCNETDLRPGETYEDLAKKYIEHLQKSFETFRTFCLERQNHKTTSQRKLKNVLHLHARVFHLFRLRPLDPGMQILEGCAPRMCVLLHVLHGYGDALHGFPGSATDPFDQLACTKTTTSRSSRSRSFPFSKELSGLFWNCCFLRS